MKIGTQNADNITNIGINLTERQLKLVKVATEILEIFREYKLEDQVCLYHIKEINRLLKYDEVEQDLGCLVDDLRIEFDL